ncbi:putative polyketide protein [Eutypa lata UCREL1]|uniref:Putative polyketide protein n=1 Tax=Eutypa lata (strain UCR-EL1) TaxID=1287681 RepID=M7SGD4_EUTLA|nr:putative polyketide protein [Eutypa lata UCREL1]
MEPIAIIGMGCRMPGDVRSPSDLWQLMMSKKMANADKVPSSRFNVDAYLHSNNERPGSFNVSGGYFLDDDLEAFDPALFGISPIGAMWMDPQHKKLLEVVYEAVENSGTTLENLAGEKVGCFVGCFTNDFQQMTIKEPDFRHTYAAIGIDSGILANRVSYVFDLKGPRYSDNIRSIFPCNQHMNTAKLGVLSPTNQSRPFDESANGYGRAEGVGAIYLKPLSAAIRDGSPIRALIRSTASSSNGRHQSGITYPSVQGQKDVISLAHKLANLNPEDTSYVECHGTGTPIGDPVEVKAIHEALAATRPKDTPVLIGSVKPNIGHSEAASSMGTLIKAVMALETGIIPPTAGVEKLNSAIPWNDYNVKVVIEPSPLPMRSLVQRIGVSAYGYGGTNAHAILESVQSHVPNYPRRQGAQWAQMGTSLMKLFPIVWQTIQSLDQHLAKLKVPPSWTIEALLNEAEDTSVVHEPEYSQPLTTAVQIAIVDLLGHWGINPAATIGHSSGEIGAAYAAGLTTAKNAIAAAYFRGKVAASLRTDGAMLAVGMGENAVRHYIEEAGFLGRVIIGCYNSPSSTTLSGDKEAIEKLKETFDEENVFARILRTGGKAYHSHHMKEAATRYQSYLQDESVVISATGLRPKVSMFSTVRTQVINAEWATIPDRYWADNLNSPVLFDQGVTHMLNKMPDISMLIEIGPHAALAGPLRQICQAYNKSGISYVPILKRKTHDVDQMLQLAGTLWAKNAPIDIGAVTCFEHMSEDAAIEKRAGSLLVDLPPYHWTYSKPSLFESRLSREHRGMKETRHDILGRRVVGPSALQPVWRNILRQRDLPWLAHHRLGGEVMLPAAGYLALAIEAISQINSESELPLVIEDYTVRDVVLSTATVVPDDDVGTETTFSLRPMEGKLEISPSGKTSQWAENVNMNITSSQHYPRYRGLQYRAAIPQEMQGNLQRDLYTKLDWKIDIDYLKWAGDARTLPDDPILTVVDTMFHKDAAARILCLDESVNLSRYPNLRSEIISLPESLQGAISAVYSGSRAQVFTNLNMAFRRPTEHEGAYALIITPEMSMTEMGKADAIQRIRQSLATGARLIIPIGTGDVRDWSTVLKSSGFSGVDCMLPGGIIMSTAVEAESIPLFDDNNDDNNAIVLVYRDAPGPLLFEVQKKMTSIGWTVRSESLDSLQELSGERVILLADTEGPLLHQLEHRHLDGLRMVTERAEFIVWVTCGGLLEGDRPEYGMTMGAARTLRHENRSMHLVTLDFDVGGTSEARVADLIADIVVRERQKGLSGETEYCMKKGAVYVARLVPYRDLNRLFVPDSGETTTLYQRARPTVRAEYKHGALVYLTDDERVSEPLGPDEVEVHVVAMGITEADGADDSPFLNHGLAGTVTRVGRNVQGLDPGTKVVGFSLDRLATLQRTSVDLVHPLRPESRLNEAASLPSAFTTAVYALEGLASIEPGDNIAIIDGMGPVALAAIQICRIVKANVILISSSTATEEFLRANTSYTPQHLISARQDGLCSRIRSAINGKRVDVVLSSISVDGALIEECVRALAPYGKIVTFGHAKRSIPLTYGSSTQTSSNHFDLVDLIWRRPRTVAKYAVCYIQPPRTIHVKGPASINEAFHSGPSDLGAGSYVIAYEESDSFQDVTYLLVGGLGGLGRHVALWMADRGASHLAFVSRTGASTPDAVEFIQSLRDRGVYAQALRADITCREDLERAVAKIPSSCPIRGVVNAATVMHDTLFHNMTITAWKKTTEPKVKGCLNLHEVFKDTPLDFFVMTSSVSSTLGSSGQSNYSAANSVLDSLAIHRTSRGLPAVSLILPAIFGIGMISQRPELEKAIKVKGMYGIEEKEMLEAFEVAMTPYASLPQDIHHIVVGVQPRRMSQAIKSTGAFVSWETDSRFNWLALAVHEQVDHSQSSISASASGMHSVLATVQQAPNAEDAIEAITICVVKRLSRLLATEAESIQLTQKSVASHGLDSMIGAEFRNWIFREFKVNIPFQQLLAGSLTVSELAETLYKKITKSSAKE